MSCGGAMTTFRLLDAIVGWERGRGPHDSQWLTGFHDPAGVTLAPLHAGEFGGISPWLPPPWLAPGCGRCEWFLAASDGPGKPPRRGRLLRLSDCACAWEPVWPDDCTPLPSADITAVASDGRRLAVADRSSGTILLFADGGDRVVARITCAEVTAMAFAPGRMLLAAVRHTPHLLRFDVAGAPLEAFLPALPDGVEAARLGIGRDGTVWVASPGVVCGTYKLWHAREGDAAFLAGTLAELAASMAQSALVDDAANGFCISRTDTDGSTISCCYGRGGEPLPPGGVVPASPAYQAQGQLLTAAIDSGIPRCVWHRVRIEADIPVGTSVSVAVSTADEPGTDAGGTSAAPWARFPAGVPHAVDWQECAAGALDFLIQQPPGRYLYVRLRLQSTNQTATPHVRRLRIDFPRVTSLDQLPAIYRGNADAADFTERFLALFDASIADLDAAIDRAPALLDAGGVPDDVLPWLGSFLGLALDPAWSPARSRAILQAIPQLYRQRGTLAGLKLAFRLVFDLEPAIEELAPARPWAALGRQSRTGSFRLFGRDRSRAIIGRSTIGATTIKSYGDPAADPFDAVAHRFQVLVPPVAGRSTLSLPRVQALVDSQKPAHTVASVRMGGGGFLVGTAAAVGIDTAFTPLPVPILGRAGNIRLNRMSVLRHRRGARLPTVWPSACNL